jgi:hypothetical protein
MRAIVVNIIILYTRFGNSVVKCGVIEMLLLYNADAIPIGTAVGDLIC